jgi:NAD(P)-dependent dehydrogenase (short-subunit alcohol dehydrogenase family)
VDVILTGASRGIGRALALALPSRYRVHAVARDAAALDSLVAARPGTRAYVADISAGAVSLELDADAPALLIHNAGVWPSRRELADGVERAWAVNVLGPLAFQAPLLPQLSRILVISAGLLVKGRFDAERTPRGDDFSWFRTYATTKLVFAVAMRDVARAYPTIDVAVIHPGVVRTGLGARGGVLGWLVDRVKRRWESPETCAERLVGFIDRERWSPPGDARWFIEGDERPWPKIVEESTEAVRVALRLPGVG